MTIYYAGIGSRQTPPDVLKTMTHVAARLRVLGCTLRSGGAVGADKAFELGAGDCSEIFTVSSVDSADNRVRNWAMASVKKYHPMPTKLKPYVQKLMARNAMQVMGADLQSPSAFVICWTPDGSEGNTSIKTGGTGQAIRIAHANNIPVFNLFHADALSRLKTHLEGLGVIEAPKPAKKRPGRPRKKAA